MPSLESLRNEIDALDDIIMNALEQRFSLMNAIKTEKQRLNLEVTQSNRESVVLNKTDKFNHHEAIKNIYKLIIDLSKSLQND